MATKKNTQEAPIEEQELATAAMPDTGDVTEALRKELESLKKENEELKKNSIYSPSASGGMSDKERVAKACQMCAEEGKDPWQQKISVMVPRIGKGEDSYWLCINGRSIQVPANDRPFNLALPFAEALVNEIEARNRAADFRDKIEEYDPITNPKPADKIG